MLNPNEVSQMIDVIYQGVEKSKCGKLLTGEKDPNGNLVYNGFALQTFMSILKSTFDKKD